MDERGMRVQCRITPKVFREFALFDTFRRQKRWRAPLLFLLILLAFAVVCFTQAGKLEGARLLGGVLAGVGVGLPVFYILYYLNSVRRTCKGLERAGSPVAYELLLAPGELGVTAQGKRRGYAWGKLHFAYRLRRCVAVYVAANQAYLIPDSGDAGHERKLWALLCEKLPEDRRRDLRG